MARSLSMMDEPQDVKRLLYISWVAGDPLSNVTHTKLVERLALADRDHSERELELIANDPTEKVGEESGKARAMRDLATDFVAIVTTKYLVLAKSRGRQADPDQNPDLFFFVDRKSVNPGAGLAMWIVPVERTDLDRVGFKDAAIPKLSFSWWHGWRDKNDQIPLPDNTFASVQVFDSAIAERVDEILHHLSDCHICKHHH